MAEIQSMRELIKAKEYSFEIGYTTALEYPIEQITGLVEPQDLNEQIMKQNQKIEQMMQQKEIVCTNLNLLVVVSHNSSNYQLNS